MLNARVVLIDKTETIEASRLAEVATALNVQVTRDLPQFLGVNATVSALPPDAGVPPGAWPVYIVANLPPGEGGIHLSDHNQPYANVEAGDGWTVAASHEVCEMLVDPSGNRLQASTAIQVNGGNVQDAPGKFEYLVEVCDPSETAEFGYIIDGVL
jgi:hypothetical protein